MKIVNYIYKFLIILYGLILSINMYSNEGNKDDYPVKFNTSYVFDIVGNTTGGISTGVTYLGLANISMSLETHTANWWEGGEFYINGANTHGSSPSENLIGDFQTISNIDGGNHTFLFECWYKHRFKKVTLTLGLQDLNAEFANTENGALFINSSFGIPSVIPTNIPVSLFPITAIGLSVDWNINDNWNWKNIIYTGEIYDFDNNKYNIKWNINPKDGILAVSELTFSTNKKYNSCYKIGGYYHNQPENSENWNYGFYFIGDQNVWQYSNKKINLFIQTAVNPTKNSTHKYYIGGGINFYGLLGKRGENCLGLAIAHAGFKGTTFKHETVIEAFYKANFLNHFFIQPDIQYIISPAGESFNKKNALAIILRGGIEF